LASRTLSAARSALRPARLLHSLSSPLAAVPAVAVPLVFIHIRYQPKWTVDLGSTDATVALSDVAVLACGLAALLAGRRHGFAPLRTGRPILAAGGALLVVVFAATAYGPAVTDGYPVATHLVTALKFAEYAVLALSMPLLLRRREDLALLLGALTVWSLAASAGAILQFVGLVNEMRGRRPGQREPSFLGYHDLAALSGATLAIGLAAVALGPVPRRERLVATAAGLAGGTGVVLSGALAGYVGTVAAAAAVVLVALRRGAFRVSRTAAVVAIVAVVGSGVLALRSENVDAFLRFVGVQPARDTDTFAGESYVQRLVLGYIGVRIFLDHPVLGVGWQGTKQEASYGPYVDDARRKYPDAPLLAFPSPEHPWGIQNAYIQAAAELGVLGLAAFLALFATGLLLGLRTATRAPPPAAPAAAIPMLWLLVTMGVWMGLGLVAGIGLTGLNWLAVGLVAAAPGGTLGERV
jgi:O-antigen ligase